MNARVCQYCNKVIEGFNEKHVEYLLLQHLISKHKDTINIKRASQIALNRKFDTSEVKHATNTTNTTKSN